MEPFKPKKKKIQLEPCNYRIEGHKLKANWQSITPTDVY